MERFHLTNGQIIEYGRTLSFSVILACFMAASHGRFFGYDLGISGGALSSNMSMAEQLTPGVQRKTLTYGPQTSVYCTYSSLRLTALAVSLYIAGVFACLVASKLSKRLGPTAVWLGAAFFFLGAFLNAAAVNCWNLDGVNN